MGERILVVDDDTSLLELMSIYLGTEGYDVLLANDTAAALRVIAEQSVSALITDALPGFAALKIIRAFREKSVVGPVILFTGLLEDEISNKARIAGATAVIGKPVGLKEISSILKRLLARSA